MSMASDEIKGQRHERQSQASRRGRAHGQKTLQFAAKRAMDVGASVLGLTFLSPFFAVVALAIRLEDGGPVFFRQARIGLGERQFRIWKFRTMVPDADRYLDERGHVGDANRITRVGRLLRLFSLDELPQLINIARGEMSLVGPRPAVPESADRYTAEQKRRFRTRPGITGLAQVRGRNTLKWSKRIEYDNEYIDTYSIWLDLWILLKTVKVVLLREGIVLDRNPEAVDDLPRPEGDAKAP
jgi:lipopolysaccharide/colanic/teichoic acid biosynthesis glycosyltransferase